MKRLAQPLSKRISVFLAEAVLVNCQLMEQALRRHRSGYDVVACALPSKEVLQRLRDHHADVFLISANLADGPLMGFNVLRGLRILRPDARVVMLVDQSTRELAIDVFRYGAKGLFQRSASFTALCRCIRAVAEGQIWATSEELNGVLKAFSEALPLRVVDAKGALILTQREEMIVQLVAEGMTNRDIGAALHLSELTVRNYLYRIYNKIGVSSRIELTLYTITHRQGTKRENFLAAS